LIGAPKVHPSLSEQRIWGNLGSRNLKNGEKQGKKLGKTPLKLRITKSW
jgi:hypothetical protein